MALAKRLRRPRTVKLFLLEDDGLRVAAGTLTVNDATELLGRWHVFLATAELGVYVARYRGESLATASAADVRP